MAISYILEVLTEKDVIGTVDDKLKVKKIERTSKVWREVKKIKCSFRFLIVLF